MQVFAETTRLILREIVPGDATSIFELDSDPEVQRYVGNKPVKSIQEAQDIVQYIIRQYKTNGIGRWAMIERSSGEFVGWSGLKLVNDQVINGHENHYDLGYRLLKKHWGKGYATEAARASLNYGFDKLKLRKIFSFADAGNKASQHVLNKLGFYKQDAFDYNGRLHYWYWISGVEQQINNF